MDVATVEAAINRCDDAVARVGHYTSNMLETVGLVHGADCWTCLVGPIDG